MISLIVKLVGGAYLSIACTTPNGEAGLIYYVSQYDGSRGTDISEVVCKVNQGNAIAKTKYEKLSSYLQSQVDKLLSTEVK